MSSKTVHFSQCSDFKGEEKQKHNAERYNSTDRRRSSAQTKAIRSRKTRKIIVLGSTRSGKTSLVKRFLDDSYADSYTPTVEESYNRDYKYLGHSLNLDIVDMCCPFMFPVMRDLHVKDTDVAMVTYEIDNKASIAGCLETHKVVKQLRPYLPVVLVGTKLDLYPPKSETKMDVGVQAKSLYTNVEEYEAVNKNFNVLSKLQLKHVLTSAKLNLNVEDAFHMCLDDVVSRIQATSVSARKEINMDAKDRLCCPTM